MWSFLALYKVYIYIITLVFACHSGYNNDFQPFCTYYYSVKDFVALK